MKRIRESVVLLALSVVLLVILSARISPSDGMADGGEGTETETEYSEYVADRAAGPKLRELFPESALTDWNLTLVNNTYVLPSTFEPRVIEVRDGQSFDARAAAALEHLLEAAEAEGYMVCVRNAYRSYSAQTYLFFDQASRLTWTGEMEYAEAEEKARELVAYPGASEHQLGLAVDLMDGPDTEMDADTARTLPLLGWLREHCAEYGFIYRYPPDKKELTGWDEPWHFRYVGEEIAAYIMENNLCLEEFVARF